MSRLRRHHLSKLLVVDGAVKTDQVIKLSALILSFGKKHLYNQLTHYYPRQLLLSSHPACDQTCRGWKMSQSWFFSKNKYIWKQSSHRKLWDSLRADGKLATQGSPLMKVNNRTISKKPGSEHHSLELSLCHSAVSILVVTTKSSLYIISPSWSMNEYVWNGSV